MSRFKMIDTTVGEIQAFLQKIIKNSQATSVVMITLDGQYITSVGDCSYINLTSLAALIAGMFAATKEVAKILGENNFNLLFQQGEKRNLHISLVNNDLLLIAIFEGVEKAGMVRLYCEKQSKAIVKLLSPPEPKNLPTTPATESESLLDEILVKTDAPKNTSAEINTEKNKTPETETTSSPSTEDFKAFASSLLDDIFGKVT